MESRTSEETSLMRLALARRDPDVVQEALTRLRDGEKGKAWFVLEGESCPDAYLETDSIVIGCGRETHRTNHH